MYGLVTCDALGRAGHGHTQPTGDQATKPRSIIRYIPQPAADLHLNLHLTFGSVQERCSNGTFWSIRWSIRGLCPFWPPVDHRLLPVVHCWTGTLVCSFPLVLLIPDSSAQSVGYSHLELTVRGLLALRGPMYLLYILATLVDYGQTVQNRVKLAVIAHGPATD